MIASSSGGFQGKLSKIVNSELTPKGGPKSEADYDPMGVFSHQRTEHNMVISREGSFKTNGYSRDERCGLSDFEFQSQNCDN